MPCNAVASTPMHYKSRLTTSRPDGWWNRHCALQPPRLFRLFTWLSLLSLSFILCASSMMMYFHSSLLSLFLHAHTTKRHGERSQEGWHAGHTPGTTARPHNVCWPNQQVACTSAKQTLCSTGLLKSHTSPSSCPPVAHDGLIGSHQDVELHRLHLLQEAAAHNPAPFSTVLHSHTHVLPHVASACPHYMYRAVNPPCCMPATDLLPAGT